MKRRLAQIAGWIFKSQQQLCRAGQHEFLDPAPVGGGILRSSCSSCGAVSLDLRDATEPVRSALFTGKGELQTFAILRRQMFRRF
jgi:hypothetical protein